MAIFDRFGSKSANDQEKKALSSTPQRKLHAKLDAVGEEAKAQYPEDSKTLDGFVARLKEIFKARYKKTPEAAGQPMKAEARFFLSQDRMRAFACVLPPENGGDEITLEELLDDIHYEGINSGILQEDIQREFAQGYLRIFPVAQGTLPQPGEDGKITELFPRREDIGLETKDGSQVDFDQEIQIQPIRKGAVICLIRPPKAGTDGTDVTGKALPCPQTVGVRIPQGDNTSIGRGGQALVADVDGILYYKDDVFCIHEQKIIDGDVDSFQGTLKVSGNLYIEGNVDGGVSIEASGDIVISGKLGQAHVTSMGGTIRVQQGVFGTEGKTLLSAARQVQASVIEWAEIGAGTDVMAEMISNSTIRCEGTVSALSGRGMIAGSLIRAGGSILCLRIGNLAGERSTFSVGYPPHSPASWNRVKADLAEAQATIKKLWDTITDLRRKGSRISDREKALLDQLVVQRDLYVEKRETLTAELSALDKVLDKRSNGRVQCEKLRPYLFVQIGRLSEEITTEMENCNIHADGNRLYLK